MHISIGASALILFACLILLRVPEVRQIFIIIMTVVALLAMGLVARLVWVDFHYDGLIEQKLIADREAVYETERAIRLRALQSTAPEADRNRRDEYSSHE